MASLHTIRLANDSPLGGNMCLYQRHSNQESEPGLFSLAWFCQPCRPGSTVTFSWTLDFGFAWAKMSSPRPGDFFEPAQTIVADPKAPGKRSVRLLRRSGQDFELEPGTAEPEAGYLLFQADGSVPPNQAAAALTVSGRPAFVFPAGPDLALTFHLDPQYWVAFGPYEPGQVLDFSEMAVTTEVIFPEGKRSAQAAFQRDCTWKIR